MTQTSNASLTNPLEFGNYTLFLVFLYISWLFVIPGIISVAADHSEGGLAAIGIGAIFGIVAVIVGCIILFRLWKFTIVMMQRAGLSPSVNSPGMAVGFCFIPFFNLYWAFIAWGKLPKDLNALADVGSSRQKMPEGLGIAIAVLAILGIVPILGYLTRFVAGCILVPIFFHRAINLCRALEQTTLSETDALPGGVTDTKSPSPLPTLTSVRSFVDLFQPPFKRFNFHLVIGLSIASILVPILRLVPYFGWDVFSYLLFDIFSVLGSFVIMVAASALFSVVCYIIPRNWLLPLVWGIVSFLIGGIWVVISGGNPLCISFGFGTSTAFGTLSEYLIYGWYDVIAAVCFMAGPVLATRLAGVRFLGLLAGMFGGMLAYYLLDGIISAVFLSEFYIPDALEFFIDTVAWLLFGVAIFLGIYFHAGRSASSGQLENVPVGAKNFSPLQNR